MTSPPTPGNSHPAPDVRALLDAPLDPRDAQALHASSPPSNFKLSPGTVTVADLIPEDQWVKIGQILGSWLATRVLPLLYQWLKKQTVSSTYMAELFGPTETAEAKGQAAPPTEAPAAPPQA